MERAYCTVARSRPLQGKIRAYQIHDVSGFADALNGFFRNKSHKSKLPCGGAKREGDFTDMQRWLLPLLFFAFLPVARSAENSIRARSVIVLPIRGPINEAQFFFLRRVLKNAENVAAAGLILDMDTGGGNAKVAAKIERMLQKSPVPAYTYVNSNTQPPGPWIALKTKKVFTAPKNSSGVAPRIVYDVGGHPVETSSVAIDVSDVAKKCNLDAARIVTVNISFLETAAYWLVCLTPLLLMGGFFGAYAGFYIPLNRAAGFLSAVCFLLFFFSHYIAGLTGLEMPALFGLGAIFIFMESFLFRGVVVLALGGIALLFTGIFFAMVDFYPAQPVKFSMDMLAGPFFNIALAGLGTVILGFLTRRRLGNFPSINAKAQTGC